MCETLVVLVASLIWVVSGISVARKIMLLGTFSRSSVRCSPMKASWNPTRSASTTASRSSLRVLAHGRPEWGIGTAK